MGGEDRQQAQFGSGQCRRSGGVWTAQLGQLGPERLGLADEGSEAGPAPEQLVDLPHERPAPARSVSAIQARASSILAWTAK